MSVAMAAPIRSTRIAAIDWMRGFVMILMVVDHASMAFDGTHDPLDSAMYPNAMTEALPGAEFFTRWMTHICAPTFVFLAGTSLAISVERRAGRNRSPRRSSSWRSIRRACGTAPSRRRTRTRS